MQDVKSKNFWSIIQQWAEQGVDIIQLAQLSWIGLSLSAGYLLSRIPLKWIKNWSETHKPAPWLSRLIEAFASVIFPFISLLMLALFPVIAEVNNMDDSVVALATQLAALWIVIRLVTYIAAPGQIRRRLSLILWVLVALHTLGLLGLAVSLMDNIAITVGDNRISLVSILKGLGIIAAMLFLAHIIGRKASGHIHSMGNLMPAWRELISKLVFFFLYLFAGMAALDIAGIDLTALAFFGGALGVSLGFGLQKIVANFISGIILLAERSIKPGDVIAVEGTYGWVNRLGLRHISILTRDGKEHLIPNELLITEKVENWSYSNNNVRIRISVGVAYHSDVRRATMLLMDAVKEEPRVLADPAPNVLLKEFGDNSVNFEIRAWIDDPANGIGNVTSAVLWRVWDKFQEFDIEIPYPQRDLHIRSMPKSFENI